MADNNSNSHTLVFKVDVSDAKGNLKDYKQYIDNLKGALLTLEKGTDEYNKVSKELKDSQQKLNEVMDIAKGKGEAVEGSYDNLSQTMSKLKKEFKATGDAARRAELATEINAINDQLKEMDASVGVFSRNVGNYSQAYEEAFKQVLGDLDKMDGKLGDIAGDMKGLIPLLKKINQTALTGLSGIKKAIAATGIGLLVLAVAELVKHFDAVRKAVGVTDEKFQQFKTNVSNVLKTIITNVIGFGNSLLQFILTPIKTIIETFKGLGNVVKDVFTGQFGKIKEDAKNAIGGINDALNNGIQFKANFGKGKEFADKLITNIQNEVKNKQGTSGGKIEVEVDIKPILSRLEEYGLGDLELLKLQMERRKAALKQQYEEEKALLEQYGIDTAKLTAEYTSNILTIEDEYNAAVLQKIQDADAVQINELLSNSEEIESILQALFDEELMMQEARNIAAAALDAQRIDDEKKALDERIKNINSFVKSTTSIIGMVADAWESSVKAQIESGKISEEEGRRQFEQIKALETSVAIINTLAAGVAAFEGITKATGGWGLAAAIAQMVATIGVGMAQVAKIQSTQLGTRSTQVTSVATPNLGSIVNEYQPTYVQNATGQSEMSQLANAIQKMPLQVSVTDIDNVQNTVRTRENETSF